MSYKDTESYRKRVKAMKEGEQFDKYSVFVDFNWTCQLCGRWTPEHLVGTGDPKEPTVDHIKPISKGGKHTRKNVILLCRSCNSKKGDRIMRFDMKNKKDFSEIIKHDKKAFAEHYRNYIDIY